MDEPMLDKRTPIEGIVYIYPIYTNMVVNRIHY